VTVIRTADLAPLRYQLPTYVLLLVLMVPTVIGKFSWPSDTAPPWLALVRGACFLTLGATLIVWPNGRLGNPLIIRVVGALIAAASLFSLVKFFLHHLV